MNRRGLIVVAVLAAGVTLLLLTRRQAMFELLEPETPATTSQVVPSPSPSPTPTPPPVPPPQNDKPIEGG
jgi:hypothetical protein